MKTQTQQTQQATCATHSTKTRNKQHVAQSNDAGEAEREPLA